MFDQIEMMRDFFTKGGPVLVSIFFLSILLWILILERYYFLYRVCPGKVNKIVKQWQERRDHSSWYALKIKDGLVSEVSTALKQRPYTNTNTNWHSSFARIVRHRNWNDLNI